MKQETIEEAAKRIYGSDVSKDVEYYAFLNGAKWQENKQDEFAIGFAEWLGENEFTMFSNGLWYSGLGRAYEAKELLKIYKRECNL